MGYACYRVGPRYGGYGVPCVCEYPDCNEEIDRGMSFACGGEPFSEVGCDRYFCGKHRISAYFTDENTPCPHGQEDCDCEWKEVCERCKKGEEPFDYKPEHPTWLRHLLRDGSWFKWRKENPDEVKLIRQQMRTLALEAHGIISPKDGAKPRKVL